MIEEEYLAHYGIQGQKWGVRRYENYNGTLTPEGKERYGKVKTKDGSETDPKKIEKYRKIKEKVSDSDDPKLVYKYRKLFNDKEIEQWKNRFNNEADILKHVPPKKKNIFEVAFESIKKGTIDMIQKPFKDAMDQFMKELFADPDADKKKQEGKKKQEDKKEDNKQEDKKKEDKKETPKTETVAFTWGPKDNQSSSSDNRNKKDNVYWTNYEDTAESIDKSLALMRYATDQWYEDKTGKK